MRRYLAALAVVVVAVAASPALGRGPTPKGFNATITVLSSNSVTCNMRLTITYNVPHNSPTPTTGFQWRGTYGGSFSTYLTPQTKVTEIWDFPLSSGQSEQVRVLAGYQNTTVGDINSNLASCV